MPTRITAFTKVLTEQLVRIGRPHASVALDADFTATIVDDDGRWRGPATVAFGVLVTCGDGDGAMLWELLAPRASAA
jgi:hypothetical protein